MRTTALVVRIAVVSLAVCASVIQLTRVSGAAEETGSLGREYQRVLRDIGELRTLRRSVQRRLPSAPPEETIQGQVALALSAIGLDDSKIEAIRREGDREVGSGEAPVRRREIEVRLRGMRMQDIGAFLVQWRWDNALWRVSTLRITTPVVTNREPVVYEARVTCAVEYVGDP